MYKEKETSVKEVRNFETVIESEYMALEEKPKDVPGVGVKIAPTLQDIIPEVKDLIKSGIDIDISLIYSHVRKISYHSDGLPILSMVLRRRRSRVKKIGYEEYGE